ncbi:hypothetical protein CHUAL_001835 [Chamberlinius hualienensis]
MAAKVLSVFMLIILIIDGNRSVRTTDISYEMATPPSPKTQHGRGYSLWVSTCSTGEVFDRVRRKCARIRTRPIN